MSPHRQQQLEERVADLDVHILTSGLAFVMNVERGTSYEVDGDHCTCLDWRRRNGGAYDGKCKHIWAVKLSEPCPICDGLMRYENGMVQQFVCGSCGYARMASIVLADRKEREATA